MRPWITRWLPLAALAAWLISAVTLHAQTLGIDGTRLTVDGRARFLLFISYFDGMHRAGHGAAALDEDFTFFREHIDGIRVLVNWCGHPCLSEGQRGAVDTLFDKEGKIRDEAWARFKTLLAAARAHSLLVDVTFTRDTFAPDAMPSMAAYAEGIGAVIARLEREAPGEYRNVFFDLHNEFTIHGFSDADVDRTIARARAAHPPVIITGSITQRSPADAASIVSARQFSVASLHDGRDAGANKRWFQAATIRDDVSALLKTGKPVAYDEPTAYCAPSSHHPCSKGGYDDAELTHFRDAALNARQAGAALWTFHTREAFDLSQGSYVSRASDQEKAVLRAIRDALKTPQR